MIILPYCLLYHYVSFGLLVENQMFSIVDCLDVLDVLSHDLYHDLSNDLSHNLSCSLYKILHYLYQCSPHDLYHDLSYGRSPDLS